MDVNYFRRFHGGGVCRELPFEGFVSEEVCRGDAYEGLHELRAPDKWHEVKQ